MWENADNKLKVDKVMDRFNAYCTPHKNVTWEKNLFNTRNQHAGETIDQYLTDLQTKARTCEFAKLKDSLIRNRIVYGIICDKMHSRLLKKSDLTLQKALDICRANKATATQLKSFGVSSTTTVHNVHQLKK